jgi:hypothetical protein
MAEMGIGRLGFQNLVFKRKFRFTFELEDICNSNVVPKHFVKLAARPNLTVSETEINFLNAKSWIPGKAEWETLSVTYMDVADSTMAPLYQWMSSVYDFTNPVQLSQGSQANDYAARGIIKLFDGCGSLMELWVLQNVWPTNINFGDLSYADSEEATIELTLRYSDVSYFNICPGFSFQSCCTSC